VPGTLGGIRFVPFRDYNTIKLPFFYLFFAQKHRLFAQKSRVLPGSRPETAVSSGTRLARFSFLCGKSDEIRLKAGESMIYCSSIILFSNKQEAHSPRRVRVPAAIKESDYDPRIH